MEGRFAQDVQALDNISMIIGLGNPGKRYMRTRHNIGYEVATRFCERHCIRLRAKRRLRSRVGVGEVAGKRVVAVVPTTFMNRSGEAAASAVGFYGVNPRDLLVIVDDVNLPLGRLRIRSNGSDGGHNGMRSVITWLGTTDFPRLRIGIGKNESRSLTDFVLGDFRKAEASVIGDAIERAAEAVEAIIVEGISSAMSRYNRRSEECAPGAGLVREGFAKKNVIAKINGEPC